MKLFHFMNANYAIQALSLQRLRISRINDINDPFEFLAADLLDEKHHSAFVKFKDDLNSRFGMICLTQDWRNPLLWSHYADRHRGIALGFEVNDEYVDEVIYSRNRVPIKFDESKREILDGENVIDLIRRTKFIDWKYESEYRLFIPLEPDDMEGGSYFQDFSDVIRVTDVLIGLNCSISKSRMKELLNNLSLKARVRKVRMSKSEFKIVEGF